MFLFHPKLCVKRDNLDFDKSKFSLFWTVTFHTSNAVISQLIRFYPSLDTELSGHHLRCGRWLNLEFSKAKNIKTIYKKNIRGMCLMALSDYNVLANVCQRMKN